ncbi:MAG: hypothetical protein Q9182_002430 [Xanthomendoza sp. 2 TL-2023]
MALSASLQLWLSLALLFSSFLVTMARELTPTNDSSPGITPFDLRVRVNAMSDRVYSMDHLTDKSGQLKITLEGDLILTDPDNVNSLSGSSIAYISCDSDAYKGNIGPDQTFDAALARSPPPLSIVLYSLNANRCNLVPLEDRSTNVYSMKDTNSSAEVVNNLKSGWVMENSTISRTHEGGGGGGGILGKSPTTAVAMIILYSITGIITALFLIIIVVGAIRAHRHPERYGPRNIHGRPRQSRAKGIARAMLETIPIVKFGDNDATKAAEPAVNSERDIEMAPSQTAPETSSQAQRHTSGTTSAIHGEQSEASNDAVTTEKASINPRTTDDPIANADNGLACSVCTDDFTKGQDVRVLPCNHKFHPECIDPWLLNVSGTCPMCRVDLRPTASNEEHHNPDATNTAASPSRRNSEALTAFNAPQNQSRRNSRARPLHYLHHYLNRGRMEEATPQERLEALRRLRLVNRSDIDHAVAQPDGNTAGEVAASGSRNRLSARLSRAFGGDRSRPVSGVPSIPATTPAVPEGREGAEVATGEAGALPSASAGEGRR